MSTFRGAAACAASATAVASCTITAPAGALSTDRVLLLVHVGSTSTLPVSATGFSALANCNAVALSTFSKVTVMSGTGYAAGSTLTVNITGGTAILGAAAIWYSSAGAVDQNNTPAVNTGGAVTLASGTTTTTAASELAIGLYTAVSGSTKSVNSVTATQRYAGTLGGGSRFMPIAIQEESVASAGTAPSVSTTISAAPSASFHVLVSLANAVAGTVRNVNVAGVATIVVRKVNVAGVATVANRRVNVGGVAT